MEKNRMNLITPHSISNSTITNFVSVRERLPIVWISKSTDHRAFSPLHHSPTPLQNLYLTDPFPIIASCNSCNNKNSRVFLSYQLLKST